jgi:hypothetical protein
MTDLAFNWACGGAAFINRISSISPHGTTIIATAATGKKPL